MNKLISVLMLIIYCIGCAGSQTINQSQSNKQQFVLKAQIHEDALRQYTQGISNKLDSCVINNDPLIDFWDKMILMPIESCLTYDSDWDKFLNQKAQEYSDFLIPGCKKEILSAFEIIGVKPKEHDYIMLRVELILACMGKPERESVRAEVFKRLTTKVDNFFMPIYEKAKQDVRQCYARLDQIVTGGVGNEFMTNYNNALYYFIDERAKLLIRAALDKKYSQIIESELKRFIKSLSGEQQQMYSLISQKDDNYSRNFLKTLTPTQYMLLERIMSKATYIQEERKIGKARAEKLNELALWLKENKSIIESKERESAQKRAEQAEKVSTIISGILGVIGFAAGCALGSYMSWRSTYYMVYQTPQAQQINTMPQTIIIYQTGAGLK